MKNWCKKRCIYSKKCLEKKKIIVKFRISDPISCKKIGEVIREIQSAIPYDILHFEVNWNDN